MIKTIILNGPPGCGKDTIAEYLVSKYQMRQLEFKAALFEFAKRASGLSKADWDLLYSRDMKEIPTGSLRIGGKDASIREYMIHMSENVVKPLLGKSYFGHKAAYSLTDGWNVFSDGGFLEELGPVAEASDMTIVARVCRRGYTFAGDSRSYLKRKDIFPLGIDLLTVLDNHGSMEDLYSEIDDAVFMWRNLYE